MRSGFELPPRGIWFFRHAVYGHSCLSWSTQYVEPAQAQ